VKAHESDVQFVDERRCEGVNISQRELQVLVRLFLIEPGKCRRQRLSDAAIGWSAPREASPDRISPSRLVVDAPGEDVVIGHAARMADVVAGRVCVVRGRIQGDEGSADRIDPVRRNDVSGKGNFGEGIDDRRRQPAEVSGALLQASAPASWS
jgi:hypothetical protein